MIAKKFSFFFIFKLEAESCRYLIGKVSVDIVRKKEKKKNVTSFAKKGNFRRDIYISYIILDFVATLLANCNWIDEIYNSDL